MFDESSGAESDAGAESEAEAEAGAEASANGPRTLAALHSHWLDGQGKTVRDRRGPAAVTGDERREIHCRRTAMGRPGR